MKKLLLVLAVLIVLAVVGFGIFIATFDADRYRPQLVQKMEQAIGRPVELDRIRLAWAGGIAVQLRGLRIGDKSGASEPLLDVDSVSAVIRLSPLLRRKVEVASIVVQHPRVRVSRDAQGRINLTGLGAAAAPVARSGAPAAAAPPAEGSVPFEADRVRIEDGAVHWVDAAAQPPADLWLRRIDVSIEPIAPPAPLNIDARAALGGDRQNLRLAARVSLPLGGRPLAIEDLSLEADALPLEQLAPPAAGDAPRIRGRLSAAVEGSIPTLAAASLARTAAARGTIKINEPVIENLNIIRTVFEKMAVLPGLMERLKARLPAEYQQKLEENDTRLEPIELAAVYEQGVLRLQNLSIQSDTFGLSAPAAAITPDGGVQAQALLRIDPAFSEALIRSVEELRGLTNANGELEIPLILNGKPPHGIRPDLQYIGSRVVVNKAIDALGELLGRGKEAEPAPGDGQPGDGTQPGASQPAPTGEELLGQLLQRALTPKSEKRP